MNEKTAKRLRRNANILAATMGAEVILHEQVENTRNRKKKLMDVRDEKGSFITGEDGVREQRLFEISVGTISNTESCVRGIYRRLKKISKNPIEGELTVEEPLDQAA